MKHKTSWAIALLTLGQAWQPVTKVPNQSFEEQIDDIVLSKAVEEYIKETKVDTMKSIVYLSLNGCRERRVIIVSNTIHNPFLFSEKPTGYSILSGHLVVLFNNASVSSPNQALEQEVYRRAKQLNIEVENEIFRTYDPVLWRVIKTQDTTIVDKDWHSSDECIL